jgi:hypothetical protein
MLIGPPSPILTYERRACTKKGIKPQSHGIIYTPPKKPIRKQHEPELGFSPVAMQMDLEDEKLASESRVNYSKLVTIEHNVKVLFIGRLYDEDFDTASQAVDKCWERRTRQIHKKHRPSHR